MFYKNDYYWRTNELTSRCLKYSLMIKLEDRLLSKTCIKLISLINMTVKWTKVFVNGLSLIRFSNKKKEEVWV